MKAVARRRVGLWMLGGLAVVAPAWAQVPVFVQARLEGDRLVPEALSTQPVDYRASDKEAAQPLRLSFDPRGFNPGFATARFECRVDTMEASCLPEKERKLPVCSSFEGLESRFVKISTFRSGYGDTPAQRGKPSAWDQMPTSSKVGAVAMAPVMAVAAAGIAVVYGPALAAVSVIGAIARPSCTGVKTRWVEFDHDGFAAAARKAWDEAGIAGRADSSAGLLWGMAARRAEVEKDWRARWAAQLEPHARFANAQPRPFKPTVQLAALTQVPTLALGQDPTQARAEFDAALQAAAQAEFTAAAARLDAEWQAWRERHVQAQQQAFAQAKSSSDMKRFANVFAQTDEAGLVDTARAQATELERSEQAADADRQARLEAERKLAEAQARRDEAEEAKRVAAFRAGLRGGAETNCGPVVELKKPLALVAAPVQGYGNAHWLRIAELYPPGFGCRFVNGSYVGR